MRFTKMQGAGNDYLYVDCTRRSIRNPEELARRMSDRHFGAGSDGLVLILPGNGETDFSMRMFNMDGSEAEMCGNATRCVGKYVHDRGLTEKTEIRLGTRAGIRIIRLQIRDGRTAGATVDMGQPEYPPESAAGEGTLEAGGRQFGYTFVSMGNPHCVIFTEDADHFDVHYYGPIIEKLPLFPQKTNVEFATVEAPGRIRMRVWERGSGETMACGTGACATLIAAALRGRTGRKASLVLNGGTLDIAWDEKTGHVLMTGPAEFIYDGEWPEDQS